MAGRPKGEKSFAAMLRIEINEASEKGGTKLRQVAAKLVEKALDGDMAAIKEVADRIDGKPAQAITGPGGGPVQFMDLSQLTDEQLTQLENIFGPLAIAASDDEGDQGGEGQT